MLMRDRFAGPMISVSIAAAAVVPLSNTRTSAQAPAASIAAPAPAQALKTPWGEPDLQGIWTDEFDTPFQRPAKYANQEFFTEEQREELDKERATLLGRRATERELIGAYNIAVFMSTKHTGARTSLIADPPNGRIPPLTPEGQKAVAADREFRLALLQSTATCKNKAVQTMCAPRQPLCCDPADARRCPGDDDDLAADGVADGWFRHLPIL
jgi:hypothetical protein